LVDESPPVAPPAV